MENLQADAQQILTSLVESWPGPTPPCLLRLYVKADLVELWRLWAEGHFPDLSVSVKGIQHFTLHGAKNSADIALALDALRDFLLHVVTHVTVVSDDSDFISLYTAIREVLGDGRNDKDVPFLWAVTDRASTLASTAKQFVPNHYVHVIHTGEIAPPASVPPRGGAREGVGSTSQDTPLSEDIAKKLLSEIPVGIFKAATCQSVIKTHWPRHPLSTAASPAFGTEFLRSIWPILKSAGAKERGSKPRRYEMTPAAKQAGRNL